MKKTIIAVILIVTMLMTASAIPAKAAVDNTELKRQMQEIFQSDQEAFSKLGSYMKNLLNRVASLSENVRITITDYYKLDEASEHFEEDLSAWFKKYNKLTIIEKKLVDTASGVISGSKHLINALNHSMTIDMFSTRMLNPEITGPIEYQVGNETIIKIDSNGEIIPLSVGFTSVIASNENGDKIIYRIFVKKPFLSMVFNVGNGEILTIALPDIELNKIHVSNNKVSVIHEGTNLIVNALKKGSSYIYVGTKDNSGNTLKYRIKIN